MKLKKVKEKNWYNGAVIVCIGVAFYMLLTNLGQVSAAMGAFLANFKPIFLGAVFAYVINPLARIFYYRLFKRMKVGSRRWTVSAILALLTAFIALTFLMVMLIPQLVQSLRMFTGNLDSYSKTLAAWIEASPLASFINIDQLHTLSDNILGTITGFLQDNAGRILNTVANSGKSILTTVIAIILAIYLLLDKVRVLKGGRRLLNALMPRTVYENALDFMLRCDSILVSFISQSLLDALIIGIVNAVFMAVMRMQYIGLISVVVAVTNLIPNFGPAIGAMIGAFILLLVNPLHALIFLIFTAILQSMDAYVLKPKLFGDSLGVSGLLILAASIVLGNMFGLLGVLLAIPAAAVLSFLYHDFFLPNQEQRRKRHDNEDLMV